MPPKPHPLSSLWFGFQVLYSLTSADERVRNEFLSRLEVWNLNGKEVQVQDLPSPCPPRELQLYCDQLDPAVPVSCMICPSRTEGRTPHCQISVKYWSGLAHFLGSLFGSLGLKREGRNCPVSYQLGSWATTLGQSKVILEFKNVSQSVFPGPPKWHIKMQIILKALHQIPMTHLRACLQLWCMVPSNLSTAPPESFLWLQRSIKCQGIHIQLDNSHPIKERSQRTYPSLSCLQ